LLHISQPDRFSTREAESCGSVRETYFRISYAARGATIERGLAVLKRLRS
jgi:aspartate/methionine/tyrosine aminotransferase